MPDPTEAEGGDRRHRIRGPACRRYLAWRRGGRRQRSWPKLTAFLETESHMFLSARVGRGPSQDSPKFRPAMKAAVGHGAIDTWLADVAFDAEHNHAYARECLDIRSTVIPLNRRNTGRKWPRTRYRSQMVKRFRRKPRGSCHRRVHGQRWQVESGFSLNKRLLGSAMRARH